MAEDCAHFPYLPLLPVFLLDLQSYS